MIDEISSPDHASKSEDTLADRPQAASNLLANMIDLRKTMSDVLNLLLSPKQNQVIDQALLLILRFFDVDRVYIADFDESECVVDFTHEVTCDGVISLREDLLRQLSEEDIPWWLSNIKRGKDIVVYDVSQLPDEAATERELLQIQQVLSLLTIPIVRKGKVSGLIGLDSVKRHRDWTEFDVENLRMLADILTIAIERGQAEYKMESSAKQIMKSETKFQIIFDKMPWGAELYDEKGYLLDINQADLDIFNIPREKALGLNMFENPNIPDYVNEKLRNGEDIFFTIDYNFQVVSNTGYYEVPDTEATKHLLVKGVTLKDPQGHIFGYLYIVFDDTENYLKREQTEDNLARLKVSVNTGDSILWEYDVDHDELKVDFSLNDNTNHNEGLFLIRNQNFKNLADYKASIHPDDFDRVYNRLFKRLLKGEIHNFATIHRCIFDGRVIWCNSNVRSYKFNQNGTPSKIVSYTTNITKQRESELELVKIKEADKLKSAFLANMSHEIRTPLNSIIGFSNIIADLDNKEERQSYLDIIRKNNDILLQLIDDILDFSKIESGKLGYKFTEVDIKSICQEIVTANIVKMNPDVQLVFDEESPSVVLNTDKRRIVQVLSNMLNNAIKFTNKGHITIYYKIQEGQLVVCIQDTGIGISPENQKRIFERFIKLDTFQQGTGLGLTICKTIIETLGGTIGVDSEGNKGSTFWFTLPLEQQQEVKTTHEPMNKVEEKPIGDIPKSHSILIAEDIYANFFLLQTILGKQYQLYHAQNGEEAIQLFKKHNPDLILMDIKMPVMDGLEAGRIIRELSDTVPIVALTAFAFEQEKDIAKSYGFTDYVVKPVDIGDLKKLIKNILK